MTRCGAPRGRCPRLHRSRLSGDNSTAWPRGAHAARVLPWAARPRLCSSFLRLPSCNNSGGPPESAREPRALPKPTLAQAKGRDGCPQPSVVEAKSLGQVGNQSVLVSRTSSSIPRLRPEYEVRVGGRGDTPPARWGQHALPAVVDIFHSTAFGAATTVCACQRRRNSPR